MKILVLSDSHGNVANMVRAVELETPDLLLHLGDCWRDARRLAERFPELPMEQVPGNCDYGSREPTEKLLLLEKHRVLMCHGHTYSVKQSLLRAGLVSAEKRLDLFLFGHTHTPLVDYHGKTLFLNPGSIGGFSRSTYGVVMATSGGVDARTAVLDG